MINLPELAERLTKLGLMNKSFYDMSRDEIHALCDAVMSCPDETVPAGGWVKPHIENGVLHIGFDSHPMYHWWTPTGMSLVDILLDAMAPWQVAKKYVGGSKVQNMNEDKWNELLAEQIPF